VLARLKDWARLIRRDVVALWLAARDPRVPFWIKALAAMVAAYALSPIDLIPDFIPVLGSLAEIVRLPLAIMGLVRLIDPAIMAENRASALKLENEPVSKSGALLIGAIWIAAAAWLLWLFWPGGAK
jgi:uncharacterized membrane protein YkvA (DUF1232 family)